MYFTVGAPWWRMVSHETNDGPPDRHLVGENLATRPGGPIRGQNRAVSGSEPAGVVTVLPTDALRAPVRAAVIAVCNAANDTDAFHELFDLIPSGGTHALVFRGEDLVSHAVITPRGSARGGQPIRGAGYFDAVAPLPAEQGRGHASAALRRLAVALEAWQIG